MLSMERMRRGCDWAVRAVAAALVAVLLVGIAATNPAAFFSRNGADPAPEEYARLAQTPEALCAYAVQTNVPAQLSRAARQMTDVGAHARAAGLYTAALAAGGNRSELLFRRGSCYMQGGNYHLAVNDFSKSHEPGCAYAWGVCEMALGRTDRAMECLENSIAQNERIHESRLLLAACRLKRGEYGEAVDVLNAAVAAGCSLTDAAYYRAAAYAALGRYDEAVADYDAAAAGAHREECLLADLCLKRGYALICLGRNDEALPELDRTLALSPESADAMLLRMQIYAQKGEADAAFSQAESYIGFYPGQTLVYSTLGELFSAGGGYGNAIRAYTLYFEQTKEPVPEAYQLRGQCYLQAGQYREAVTDLTACLEKLPDANLRARYLRGISYLQLAEYDLALEDLTACAEAVDLLKRQEDAAAADPIDADVRNSRYYRGVGLMRLGRYAEAIADFDACVRADSNAALAVFLRGCCYMDTQAYEKAVPDFEACRAAGVETENSLYYLAACRMGLEEYQKAAELFTECMQNASTAVQAQYNRGMCYLQLGESEKGAADLEAALGKEE